MHRIVIFVGSADSITTPLVRAACKAVQEREDMDLVAICMPSYPDYLKLTARYLQKTCIRALKAAKGELHPGKIFRPWPFHSRRFARKLDAVFLVPPEGGVNDPDFLQRICDQSRPNFALSFFYPQRFCPELLSVFDHSINFHNGLLPKYRGVMVTAWAYYMGETESGFSFHRMLPELDAGPVLLQGTVPQNKNDSVAYIEFEKARLGATKLPEILEMTVQDHPGHPQAGESNYFSSKMLRVIKTIPNPQKLSGDELISRIRAFGELNVMVGDSWHRFNRIEPVTESTRRFRYVCFQGSDGEFRGHVS